MSKSITDVFELSTEDPSEAGPLLSVAGFRGRTPLYAAEIKNLERRQAYKARRGESTVAITNRLARVGMQNATIEGEVTKLRYVAEGTDGKAAIYGQVTVGGVGAGGLIVAAYDLEGKPIEPAVRTDPNGTFVLIVDPAQQVRIVVSTDDLKALKCVDAVFDLVKQPRYDVNIQVDSVDPVPIDPEYPCELPPDPGDGGDNGGGTEPQPRLVEVPDLVGLTLEEASDKLIAVGLSGDFSTSPDREKDGVVIKQGVPAGHKVDAGTAIPAILAVRELPRVPDVRGKTGRDAAVIIKEAGFEASIVQSPGDGEPGIVFDQFPEPDTPARPGSRVGALVVEEKQETERVEVPSVVGEPLKDAGTILRNAGLQIGALSEIAIEEGPEGIVRKQDPVEGSAVPRATPVDLVVTRVVRTNRTMPKVTGTAAQSTRALSGNNWADVRVLFSADPSSRFEVLRQKPAEGDEVRGTEVVTLVVQPQTAWKTAPQRGVAQLFQFSSDWLRAGTSATVTKTVAQAISSMSLDDLRRLVAAGPEATAEKLQLDGRTLAEPLHEAVAFGIRAMAQMP